MSKTLKAEPVGVPMPTMAAEGRDPRVTPLHPGGVLSPHGQAVSITRIVYDTAEARVGVAAAHRLAADVFEVLVEGLE